MIKIRTIADDIKRHMLKLRDFTLGTAYASRLGKERLARMFATKTITLDRRIAAPTIIASMLGASIFYAALAQEQLDAARAERDSKLELLSRLSGNTASRTGTAPTTSAMAPDMLFVVAETSTTAAAEVDRLVRAVVVKANGTIQSTQTSIEQATDVSAKRIEIQAIIEGELETIQRMLVNIETGTPLMFIDDITLQPIERQTTKRGKPQTPPLQASLTLSAFWRAAP